MSKGKYKQNIKEVLEAQKIKLTSFVSSFTAGNGANLNDGIERTEVPAVSGIKPEHSYIIRVSGDSMLPFINPDDIIVIDTSTTSYKTGDVVAVCLNGDYLVKIYEKGSQCVYLASFNREYEPIRVYDDDSFQILGKATKIVRDI